MTEVETSSTGRAGRDARVEQALNGIREDLGRLATDLAVLAAGQPRLLEIVEDHEKRLRVQEAVAAQFSAMNVEMARLSTALTNAETRVAAIRSELDQTSWVPKLGWSLLIGVTSLVVGWLFSNVVPAP